MRWSMLPVSVAVHAAALFVFLITPVVAGVHLPVPWPLSTAYVAAMASPPPLPVHRAASTPKPATGAPTQAPDHISQDDVESSDGPIVDGGLPSVGPATVGLSAHVGLNVDVPPPPPAPAIERPHPVRVGGVIREPRKLVHVAAEYPEIARRAHVEGLVVIEAMIDERGRVIDARVLRSVPLLDAAALTAVKEWRYTPTLLNGVPVRVLMAVTFNFKLGDLTP